MRNTNPFDLPVGRGTPATAQVFFGWKVVVTACAIAACTFGFGYFGPAVFLNVLHAQRGWSISIVSAAITAHFLISALLVQWLPDAHHRFGVAPTTLAGIAALLLGMLGWSLAGAPWQLFAATLLSGIGWAATSGAAIIAMVSPWFDRRRALALGHALNGASIGGVLFSPLWVTVIAAIGLAGAIAVVGAVTFTVLTPLTLRYLRPTPESLRLAADGDGPRLEPQRRRPGRPSEASLAQFMRRRSFATLSVAFALGMFAQVGVTAHIVARLAPLFGAQHAAMAISLTTGCAMLGRVLLGILLGRADRRLVAAGNFAMQACGVSLIAAGSTATVLVAGCVLFGLGIGSLLLLPPLIAQRDFAATEVPRVVALVTAINQAVFAFAPATLGLLREFSGGYTLPFLIAAAIQLLASTIVVMDRQRAG
ncbi:MAG TPA: MFS transporter [Acetobacteraceae bacterium]|nr:MFS transporter [Acetobacteraceae bacterium]